MASGLYTIVKSLINIVDKIKHGRVISFLNISHRCAEGHLFIGLTSPWINLPFIIFDLLDG